MFDRYNTEEKNIELRKSEEKAEKENLKNNKEEVVNQVSSEVLQVAVENKDGTENIPQEIIMENKENNAAPEVQNDHENNRKYFFGINISDISFLRWFKGIFNK